MRLVSNIDVFNCLWKMIFIKVMNSFAILLEGDKRFLFVWLLYYVSANIQVNTVTTFHTVKYIF